MRVLAIPALELSPSLGDALTNCLPALELLCIGGETYTLTRTPHGVEAEMWSERRAAYHLVDELRDMGVDVEFTPWTVRLPWYW